ncbi:membrane protein [Sulfitobacter donghicola]|uniref:Membrane protein n=1 Tax=Sulfitobacter donghicola DSW-25 = KCTC 12864 = JCM 14565 TaxID=1300350 RepID=A0A073IIA7_9RHOB|nr:membrane protein [Sulfitobacter donghicola]KEJ89256.1 membrane protein [Sulfitobacter donghicola DSW-25 = KCTC 12864 = JCM 14565]KIN69052.1 putative membrane protein [Sulfitobacter donghicola DSW-25 = KCTC 12864 = JCM 14565]
MPNGIAYLMLLIWPFACLVLFRTQSVERAIVWSILGGYLLLPPLAEFNLPLVPAMDKVSIPSLSVLAILVFATAHKVNLLPEGRIARILVFLLVFSAIPTVLTNREPILFEVLSNADPILFLIDALPGQSVRDIGSVLIGQILTIVPFLVARQFLSTETGLKELLLALMIGAIAYSVPSFVEIRVSPQMNVWVYGFFQHSFEQTIRAGGYRPIVFLPHGLWLALFVCNGAMAAAALARVWPKLSRWKAVLWVVYLMLFLLACKSAASIAYGMLLVPLIYFAPRRWLILLATLFALIAVTYPMLRNVGVIPTDAIVAKVAEVNPNRAQSLGYRFDNEEQLLDRAAVKPAFGWSGWGRSLVRDSESGEILTIPDGRWIIVFGSFGWLGYIAEFGLLSLPLLLLGVYALRNRQAELSPYIGAVALILGITLMDMLLNATLTAFTWLTAGAILGYAERLNPRRAHVPRYALRNRPIMDREKRAESQSLL